MSIPLRVYLDSADYSRLSDPRRATAASAEIVERLIAFRDAGQVEFWFSGLHVSEMAPLEDKSVEAAIAEANCWPTYAGETHSFRSTDWLN